MNWILSNDGWFASAKWCLLLGAIVALLFLVGAPTGGSFSWPDSARHALNGAFVMDFVHAAPLGDPKGWAYDYYAHYPALTILFYPPLFPILLAAFYEILGVSQETAVVFLFFSYAIFACGVFFLARQWLPAPLAFGVALIMATAPDLAYWGRQVMLEIPAFAFLIWSAYFIIRYIKVRRSSLLYISIFLLVLGAYVKISILFMGAPYLLAFLHSQGRGLFRDKHIYLVTALGVAALLPLAFLTVEFGQANVQSATGIVDSTTSRLSISGWLWYAQKLPSQIGWPALAAAIAFLILWLWPRGENRPRLEHQLFLLSWFVVGYLFFSAIDLKEARHSVFLLLPVALFAGLACNYIFRRRRHLATVSILLIGAGTLVITLTTRPVHYVDGYQAVSKYVAELAPKDSNVMFSGYRDGAFIFNMRAHADRPDVGVIRADKLLLGISVRRSLGVTQQNYDEAEIAQMISEMAVKYVVAQPDFWTDLEQMNRLQSVLLGDQFREVKRFKMLANYPSQENELVVYENLGDVADGPVDITIQLPIIGRSVSGTVGGTD